MKKSIIALLIVLSLFSISSLSFAVSFGKSMGIGYMVVEGTVVSVDKTKNIFAVKDRDDGKIYGLSAFDVTSLNKGDNVTVTVPLPGSLASKITK